MILGVPRKLKSQFRLTYNMILNLLRVEALKIEEMIKRSFGENTTQTLLPAHELEIAAKQGQLKDIWKEQCETCDIDMKTCHQAAMDVRALSETILKSALAIPAGRATLGIGRLLVIQQSVRGFPRTVVGVLLTVTKGRTRTIGVVSKGFSENCASFIHVYLIDIAGTKKQPSERTRIVSVCLNANHLLGDLVPFALAKVVQLPALTPGDYRLREMIVPVDAIEYVTKTVVKVRA